MRGCGADGCAQSPPIKCCQTFDAFVNQMCVYLRIFEVSHSLYHHLFVLNFVERSKMQPLFMFLFSAIDRVLFPHFHCYPIQVSENSENVHEWSMFESELG